MLFNTFKKFAVAFLISFSVVYIISRFFPKVLVAVLPFVLAYFISKTIAPVVEKIKSNLTKKAVVVVLLVAIITALLFVLFKLGIQAVNMSYSLSKKVNEIINKNADYPDFINSIINYYEKLPASKQLFVDNMLELLKENIISITNLFLKSSLGFAKDFISFLPNAVIFAVVTFLATYFLTVDTENIEKFFAKFLSKEMFLKMHQIKRKTELAIGGYIKAQGILMLITFSVLFIGFSFLKIKYNVLFAFVIALVDALPIFGTGVFLIPWSAVNLISGNYKLAVELIIIYLTAMLIRQFTEPKIISAKIGLHPFITLMSMYVFLKFFGFFGMIAGPLTVLVILSFIE